MAANNAKSYREERKIVQPATSEVVYFNDTYPNYIHVSNPGNAALYIGVNGNVTASSFDLVIPPYGTRLYARMSGTTRLNLFTDSVEPVSVVVGSWEGEFDPASIAQSTEMIGAGKDGLLGIVEVNNILSPLPTGTNVIGGVVVAGFDVQLPTGNNNIGRVTVENGSVVVTDLPVQSATWAKVTAAAAGDMVVKATPGVVYALASDGTVQLKDGTAAAWKVGDFDFHTPIAATTSIVLTFAAAGDAFILYK